ncbi:Synaptosomal-associated protein 47 [Frankliniella fusca]|uniref:Synaptosomal-associated protein 47 n=1 Tax=Frankliniella fusca TaxID=407009 RepID=A0AAE1I5J5_9NEOP|nr:Synaptosomal-associated protein 47 [Frankliniella fusca]
MKTGSIYKLGHVEEQWILHWCSDLLHGGIKSDWKALLVGTTHAVKIHNQFCGKVYCTQAPMHAKLPKEESAEDMDVMVSFSKKCKISVDNLIRGFSSVGFALPRAEPDFAS